MTSARVTRLVVSLTGAGLGCTETGVGTRGEENIGVDARGDENIGAGIGVGGGGGERTRPAAGVTAAGVAASRNGSGVTNRLGDEFRTRAEDGESGDSMKADLALKGRRAGVAIGRGVAILSGSAVGTTARDASSCLA